MLLRPLLTPALVAAPLCFAQSEKGPAILRPAAESVVKPGVITVIARTTGPSKLLLDGKPLPVKSLASNALMSDLKLVPGPHEISLETAAGRQTIRVFAADDPAQSPGKWPAYRTHPPAATCNTCHAAQEGMLGLKGGSAAENCGTCHNLEKFPETHTHAVIVLEECQLCHDPHGSTAAFHLRFKKETACKQCHG